ncbi:MAG TPA: thioredoxin family protein [Tepidisphaeraceae bacterium]|jgi:peroxiredoxin
MRKLFMTLVALGLIAVWTVNSQADQASLGQRAPAFTAQDQQGKTVSLSDFAGKIVVLEWINPDCPFVQRHAHDHTMKDLAARYKDVIWIGVNTTKSATNPIDADWAKQNGLTYPILNDSSSQIGQAYGAKTTPHMFVIDRKGNLVYRGAIDNDPDGKKTSDKINYVQRALDELLAGKPVSIPETKSYGCAVKYR